MKAFIHTFHLIFLLSPALHAHDPVILSEEGVHNLGLETVEVEEADFEETTFALGRTEAIPQNRSVLSSRVPGRVIENRLLIGATVQKGDKLVLLESRQPGDPPPSVWLTAPAKGTVISVNTALGSPVEPSDSLAEIADLDTLYLVANLPQTTAGKVGQGAVARVRFPLLPEEDFTAKLLDHSFCPCPDPACATGWNITPRPENGPNPDINTVGMIFTIDNPQQRLRPGMNAECVVVMERREGVLSVPREALQGGPSNRHVYVKHMSIPHAFDRVPVHTGRIGGQRVEILDGLFPGDEVVTRGSYSLGFAGGGSGISLKEALDAAHGHEHNEDGSEMTPEQRAAREAEKSGAAAHAHGESGLSSREILLIIGCGVLAAALLIVSLRRSTPLDPRAELS